MATRVEVQFEAGGMPVRIMVEPESNVDGVILLRDELRERFIAKNGLTLRRGLPPGLRVKGQDGSDVTEQLVQAGFGPGVCYMIGLQVFCW